jgi:exopolyphosphatase / guanosine-5'-triphosphate,3'-diphosphate pyrophosphatase
MDSSGGADGVATEPHPSHGPFGRPLFEDAAARAMARVGVVDVGSNSVRLVVFDGAARSPAYFYNEKIMAGLGAGVAETGRLNPEGKRRALAALKRFALLAEGMGIAPLTVVATAAVREAEDGPAFGEEIARETGLRLYVIDGEEEARLSAQGVLLGWPGAEGLVCDIGGSSMEMAELKGGQIGRRVTSALGPLALERLAGSKKDLANHIERTVAGLVDLMGRDHKRLFLVGGSWRAIARVDMERRSYPLHVLHEYRMTREDVAATVNLIQASEVARLRAQTGIGEARMALVPMAAQVLAAVVEAFRPREIAVSSYGIREGLLYEQMPPEMQARDPLVESCRHAEAKDARLPGFGKMLFNFVLPLFPDLPPDRLRLVKAACLLHDVSWRAHPDYRHEVCFDNATRANLAGISHDERIWLGVALLHRYKNSRSGSRYAPLFALLSPDALRSAEILGKAMRFGAMFSVRDPEDMGRLSWQPKKSLLTLRLSPHGEPLFGEVAAARLASLASAMGATTEVRVDAPAA